MRAPRPPQTPPTFNASGPSSGDQGRGMLLQSIRAGKALKKTVTVDKSGPAIVGKVKGETSNNTDNSGSGALGSSNTSSNTSSNNGGSVGLGGLFSGGMPKLKPTGLRGNMAERDTGTAVNSNTASNASSSATPSLKRGPPPMPPSAAQKPQVFNQIQNTTDFVATSNVETLRGSGKPTIAPRPPAPPSITPQKPSPPPKKLNLTSMAGGASVSRAQSMRLPHSPPVLAPIPSSLHQSQDFLNETHPRPAGRILRPPVAKPPSPPLFRAAGNIGAAAAAAAVATRAAPLPPSRVVVTAPADPPPPPPLLLRSAPTHQRVAPPPPTPPQPPPLPPTPPTRGSSMRNGQSATSLDFEVRFSEMFHTALNFPAPEPFRGFPKVYDSRNVAKQQAPAPPSLQSTSTPSTVLQLNASSGGKQWPHNSASSAC